MIFNAPNVKFSPALLAIHFKLMSKEIWPKHAKNDFLMIPHLVDKVQATVGSNPGSATGFNVTLLVYNVEIYYTV